MLVKWSQLKIPAQPENHHFTCNRVITVGPSLISTPTWKESLTTNVTKHKHHLIFFYLFHYPTSNSRSKRWPLIHRKKKEQKQTYRGDATCKQCLQLRRARKRSHTWSTGHQIPTFSHCSNCFLFYRRITLSCSSLSGAPAPGLVWSVYLSWLTKSFQFFFMWILISNISGSQRLTDIKLEDFTFFQLWVCSTNL